MTFYIAKFLMRINYPGGGKKKFTIAPKGFGGG